MPPPPVKTWLVVTGTPVQNNLRELWGIMSLLDPAQYGDEEEFYHNFGGRLRGPDPTADQVRDVQVCHVLSRILGSWLRCRSVMHF